MTPLFKIVLVVLALLATGIGLATAEGGLIPEDPTQLVKLLVFWPTSQSEYVFLACAWLGIVVHWLNSRRKKTLRVSLSSYLLQTYKGRSLATVVVIYVAVMGLLMAGVAKDAALPGAAIGGVAVGWVIDSLINKG